MPTKDRWHKERGLARALGGEFVPPSIRKKMEEGKDRTDFIHPDYYMKVYPHREFHEWMTKKINGICARRLNLSRPSVLVIDPESPGSPYSYGNYIVCMRVNTFRKLMGMAEKERLEREIKRERFELLKRQHEDIPDPFDFLVSRD